MSQIYEYFDYRKFIRDCICDKQKINPSFSIRAAAQMLGINSGSLTRIINGTRHLGPLLLPKFISFLNLRQKESDYFALLVHFARTSDSSRKRDYYNEILRIRGEKSKVLKENQYRFFDQWYYIALFQLLKIVENTDDPEKLGSMLTPPVSAFKTRKALELLEQLKFIKKNDVGGYETVEPTLETGEIWQSIAIHNYQIAMAKMGVKAFDLFKRIECDFSTLSLSLSQKSLQKASEIIMRARKEIVALEQDEHDPERVYQLNMQLFPVSVNVSNVTKEKS